ncbi:hypothetical protein D4764_13G0012130 [Takifugu flavidus]|uniref:Reverse transcriptase domain-containing protein n=1 Tax=Takifugu flavidus TaxID=433684 RepID=A0A5C6PCU8_9TELE|nr:hypothetical protein D4764_13G0012130 [Takifugu flavidus]
MCYVDLEKAYDRVPRSILLGVLREYRVEGPLIRAIQSLYQRSKSLVWITGCKSDLSPVRVGLRQGCPLSLVLTFMDRISRRSQGVEGVEFGGWKILSLLFVDDVVLLAPSNKGFQQMLGWFATECEAAGMWISTSQSEAMVFARKKIQAAEMSFLCRVARLNLSDRVRSSDIREEPGIEPLLLHIKRSQLGWLGHLARMPCGRLPLEVFWTCPTRRRPRGWPRTRWRDYISCLAWERLGVPLEELMKVAGERAVWASLLKLLPLRPGSR